MSKITLVTGGAGFLGRHLVQSLLDEGREVMVIDKNIREPLPDGVHWLELDLAAHTIFFGKNHPGNLLCRSIREDNGWELEELYHFASPASPPVYKKRRVETLRLGGHVLDQLLGLAEETGARLCYASSSEIYGRPPITQIPTPESFPGLVHSIGPRSCYDEAKRYGEALCEAWHLEHGVDARIVRIHNTYGPGMPASDGRLVARLIWCALQGLPFEMHGDGRQTRSLCFVSDTIAGIRAVMEKGAPAVPVNVGGDDEISIRELVDHVELELKRDIQIQLAPPQDAHDPPRRRPDLSRLKNLGWEQKVPLGPGIQMTAEWMRGRSETGEALSS